MVSIVAEQWPDTVLPTVETITPTPNRSLTLVVAPEHVFYAWEQIALELAKIPCDVFCRCKEEPVTKTLLYGCRVMPLRITEIVHKCRVRGFMQSSCGAIDLVCPSTETFKGNGWRAAPEQIHSIEIRTVSGALVLKTCPTESKVPWLDLSTADKLSCWLCSVSSKENTRATNNIVQSLVASGQLTDNMLNILM